MGTVVVDLQLAITPIFRFSGHTIQPLGQIKLLVPRGEEPRKRTSLTMFTIVEMPSSSNIILGCSVLSVFQAIASSYHQKIKFLVGTEVGEV